MTLPDGVEGDEPECIKYFNADGDGDDVIVPLKSPHSHARRRHSLPTASQ